MRTKLNPHSLSHHHFYKKVWKKHNSPGGGYNWECKITSEGRAQFPLWYGSETRQQMQKIDFMGRIKLFKALHK